MVLALGLEGQIPIGLSDKGGGDIPGRRHSFGEKRDSRLHDGCELKTGVGKGEAGM